MKTLKQIDDFMLRCRNRRKLRRCKKAMRILNARVEVAKNTF